MTDRKFLKCLSHIADLANSGKPGDVSSEIAKIIKDYPGFGEIYEHFALGYDCCMRFRADDISTESAADEAISEFSQVIQSKYCFPLAHFYRGMAYLGKFRTGVTRIAREQFSFGVSAREASSKLAQNKNLLRQALFDIEIYLKSKPGREMRKKAEAVFESFSSLL